MISKIYNSNIPIWKSGSIKGKNKKDIESEFEKQNSYKSKVKKAIPNDIKRKMKLAEDFRKRNPHLFN